MSRVYKGKLRGGQVGGFDEISGHPLTKERGIYRAELRDLLRAPFSTLPQNPTPKQVKRAKRDHLVILLLWDTWARLNEMLSVDVEDLDLEHRTVYLRNTKRKVRGDGPGVIVARVTDYTQGAKLKIIEYLEGRRAGPLFLSGKGGRLSSRVVREMVHGCAAKAGLQKVIGYTKDRQPRFLISPKGLREAGEAYAVMEGMDRPTAAARAGHSEEVQATNYTKYDEIRARDLADRHRPDLTGGGGGPR